MRSFGTFVLDTCGAGLIWIVFFAGATIVKLVEGDLYWAGSWCLVLAGTVIALVTERWGDE